MKSLAILSRLSREIFGGEAHGFAGNARANAGKGARVVSVHDRYPH